LRALLREIALHVEYRRAESFRITAEARKRRTRREGKRDSKPSIAICTKVTARITAQEESGEEEAIQGEPSSSNNGIEAEGKKERRGVDKDQASELCPYNCETKREVEESESSQRKRATAICSQLQE
jgi:hypothetical protein